MAVVVKALIPAKDAENAQTTQYTATGVKAIIDKFTGRNHTAGAVTLAVNLVTSAGAAAATNLVVSKSLAAGETYTFPELVGQVLDEGGFISTIAGAGASIAIRASGREIT